MTPFDWTYWFNLGLRGSIILEKDTGKVSRYHRRIRKLFFQKYGEFWCAVCQEPLTPERSTVDHIVPTSLGGTYSPENLTLTCGRCNSSRSSQPFYFWRIHRQWKLDKQRGHRHINFNLPVRTLIGDSLT